MDLQKTFPEKPGVSQMSGSPSMRRGDTNEGLNNPTKGGCLGNNIGLTGNVAISTAYRLSVLEILRMVHTICFILHFL